MRGLANLAHLYLVRLKARAVLVQELFAILGIAVGVALLFASQVASTSLNGSVAQLTSGVIGRATLQLEARDSYGFSERLLGQVQRTPGVQTAVPVLEQRVGVIGPKGSENVDLIGVEPRMVRLASPLLLRFGASRLAHAKALAVPVSVAAATGAGPLETVRLQIGSRLTTGLIATELSNEQIGPLAYSPIAIAPLSYAQRLTGMHARISRILVRPRAGFDRSVKTALVAIAAGHENVEPANFDSTVFSQAAGPINQSTNAFAAICALVGFMFAYSSMLLTVHLRRGFVRELRRNGATRPYTVKALLLDALILGVVASLLGLALGELLSVTVFRSNTGYLSFGFPVGSHRIVTWPSVLIAVCGGLLAASIGVFTPLREIWTRPRRDESTRPRHTRLAQSIAMTLAGLACIFATTIILIATPQSAVLGISLLILALVCLLPPLLDGFLAILDRLPETIFAGANRLAAIQLRERGSRARSLAIAATGAVAVFAGVTIQGSHSNLQSGLDRLFHEVTSASSVWVLPFGSQNLLATYPFHSAILPELRGLPGVKSVGLYRASLLEYGDRRVWVLAPPGTTQAPVPVKQLVSGAITNADTELHDGGWAVISQALASQHHLRIGQSFTLPAPRPIVLRIAALSTNLGWPPGAVILNSRDYERAWGSADPSAYEVALSPGYSAENVRGEIQRALGPNSGLTVESARQRDQLQRIASRQGLGRLSQISTLVLLAGLLATVTAMGAMIWQRRRRFARLKVQGYATGVLWTALICESASLLLVGCLLGAALGIYGQLLLSHALLSVTGMPVVFSPRAALAIGSFVIVSVAGGIIVAIPGYRVASVAPRP
ncbi:MAG: FtsX-like permease family protein [Solirubrobacteraceae bacterium]